MKTAVKINAHPAQIFRAITDPLLCRQWLGDAVEIIPGPAPLDKPGARFTQRMHLAGKATDYPGIILDYDKNLLMRAQTQSPNFSSTVSYRLQMMGTNAHPQTHLEYELEFKGKNFQGKLISGLMGAMSRVMCAKQIKKLKDFVESGPA